MPHDESERSPHQLARLIAIVAGIAGALLCAVVPLLPVKQTTATILWPQGLNADGHVTDITAPLVSGAPRALDISIPCAAIATLPADGGLVVSTLPANGFETGKNGLFVRANKDAVVVAFRDSVAAVAPRSAVAAGACSVLHIWADAGGAGADFVGIPGAAGTLAAGEEARGRRDLHRPEGARAAGTVGPHRRRHPVHRRPHAAQEGVMALGGLAVLAAIIALAVLDRQSGRRTPRNWRGVGYRSGTATWLADAGVIATLLLWHVIGATSSDDGYNLTIARVAPTGRLRGQLLPLLRDDRGAVRLVPIGAGQTGLGEHRGRVDAATGHAGRDRLLADHQPLGAAAAGPRQGRPGEPTAWRC